MKVLSNFFNTISTTGTSDKYTQKENLKITLTNQFSLVLSLTAFQWIYIFLIFGLKTQSLVAVISICSFLLTIVSNKFRLHSFAKYLIISGPCLSICYFGPILGHDSNSHLIFLSTIGFPLLLFNSHEKLKIYLGALIPTTSLLVYDMGFFTFITPLDISPNDMRYIKIFADLTSIITLTMIFKSTLDNWNKSETLLKKSYEEIVHSRRLSEKLNHQVTYANLVQGISHEIKNPIGMILLSVQSTIRELSESKEIIKIVRKLDGLLGDIQTKFSVDPIYELEIREIHNLLSRVSRQRRDAIEVAQDIQGLMLRLKDITETMLKYGQAGSGEKEQVDLQALLHSILSISKNTFQQKYIQVINRLKTTPPVYASQNIYQVFMNIISNAVDAMEKGGRLKISTKESKYKSPTSGQVINGVCVVIKDSGCGIPKENLEKIFDPAFTTKYKNYGYGLSLAFKILMANDGLPIVRSEENAGTTFSIYLPTYVES